MKKKLCAFITCVCLAMASMTGCTSSTPSASSAVENPAPQSAAADKTVPKAPTYVIKVSHVFAPNSPDNMELVAAADKILERTNGDVELQVYPSGELPNYKDGLEMALSGAPFFVSEGPGELADYIPELGIINFGILYDDFEDFENLMKEDFIKAEFEKAEAQGIHIISMSGFAGKRHVLSSKEIKTPADLKGMKVRIPQNPLFINTFTAWGAVPVAMAWGEAYSSLQQGVIDAVECDYGNLVDAKMYEIKNKLSLTGHMCGVNGIVAGKDYWDTLPAEYQQIITEEIEASYMRQNRIAAEKAAELQKELEKNGVTVSEVDKGAFAEATKGVLEKFALYQQVSSALAKY